MKKLQCINCLDAYETDYPDTFYFCSNRCLKEYFEFHKKEKDLYINDTNDDLNA